MSYKSDMNFILNNIYFSIDFSDIPATKGDFICLVDGLQKDNLISEKTSQNIYLSMDRQKKKAYIVCGSYKMRVF